MIKKGNWALVNAEGKPVSVGDKVFDLKAKSHTVADASPPRAMGRVGHIVVDDGLIMNPQALDVFWVENQQEPA